MVRRWYGDGGGEGQGEEGRQRRTVFVGLPLRITVLPIGEIGHRVLGRGGAERNECPPTREGPMVGSPAFVATWRAAIKRAAPFKRGLPRSRHRTQGIPTPKSPAARRRPPRAKKR